MCFLKLHYCSQVCLLRDFHHRFVLQRSILLPDLHRYALYIFNLVCCCVFCCGQQCGQRGVHGLRAASRAVLALSRVIASACLQAVLLVKVPRLFSQKSVLKRLVIPVNGCDCDTEGLYMCHCYEKNHLNLEGRFYSKWPSGSQFDFPLLACDAFVRMNHRAITMMLSVSLC